MRNLDKNWIDTPRPPPAPEVPKKLQKQTQVNSFALLSWLKEMFRNECFWARSVVRSQRFPSCWILLWLCFFKFFFHPLSKSGDGKRRVLVSSMSVHKISHWVNDFFGLGGYEYHVDFVVIVLLTRCEYCKLSSNISRTKKKKKHEDVQQ